MFYDFSSVPPSYTWGLYHTQNIKKKKNKFSIHHILIDLYLLVGSSSVPTTSSSRASCRPPNASSPWSTAMTCSPLSALFRWRRLSLFGSTVGSISTSSSVSSSMSSYHSSSPSSWTLMNWSKHAMNEGFHVPGIHKLLSTRKRGAAF